MKNKELLNTCYKFFNRFITAEVLVEQLDNIDKTKLLETDIEETKKLIDGIKEILNNTPNEVDEYVLNEKENISNLIKKLEQISDIEFVNNEVVNLKKDYERELDSYERWYKVTDYIDSNDYFTKTFESLTDYELLEFITQNIHAPFPPNLTQEKFDKLVKVGIVEDKREWLWRLAFNYERKNMSFDDIVDYFINKKDGYYLAELISAVGECLNIDNIIDKINDKELIDDLVRRKSVLNHYVSEEQFDRLINK